MDFSPDPDLPPELRDVEERLRQARLSFSELEMNQLKLRTMKRASRAPSSGFGRPRGTMMRSRILALTVSALLLGGATAAAIAAGGGGESSNAASAQYKPGKGCGHDNHTQKCPPQSANGTGK